MLDTFTTHLTSASAEHESNIIGLHNSIQARDNHISLKDQVISRLMTPSVAAMTLYMNSRQTYLNSLISSDEYLEWRTPITHSFGLSAFHGGADSLIREGGSFGNPNDWTSSSSFCGGDHWSLELWSTALLSANNPSLPGYREILLPDIKHYQNLWDGFHLISEQYISEAGLSNTFTVADLVKYKDEWDYGMEWIHSNPTLDFGVTPGINYKITSAENNITYFNTLTAASDRKRTISARFNYPDASAPLS